MERTDSPIAYKVPVKDSSLPQSSLALNDNIHKKIGIYKRSLSLFLVMFICFVVVGIFLFLQYSDKTKITRPHILIKSAQTVNYFSVVAVSPQSGSSDNASNTSIEITFSEPVRPANLKNYFTVSPMIPGNFTQGATPNQVVFTPKYPFGGGTSVKVILNKGFESVAGHKFTSDYTYNFYTRILDNTVVFENDTIYSRWVNLPVGKGITFHLHVGDGISPNATITTYKGTFDKIVSSLLYASESHQDTNYLTQTYIDYPVDTTNMEKVSQITNIQSTPDLNFNQGEGLYYIEAKSDNEVVGSTWVSVNDEGLIVKQDDQKVTIAVQNIKTGDINTPVKVYLYNLQDKPTLLQTANIQSYGEIPIAYPQQVDLVVGQTANGVILAPLTVPETQADIRVTNNLSTLDKIYIQTDRPTYTTQDTVQFSGVVRLDNDAQYSLPSAGAQIEVWVPDPTNTANKLIDQTVTIGDGGIFSGQFTLPSSLVTVGGTTASLTLYARATSDTSTNITSKYYTTFDIVSPNAKAIIKVSFDKNNYTRDENVTAHISAFDDSGKPMANRSVTYTIYAKDYYEGDPTSVATLGNDWGERTKITDQTVTLDANGRADVNIEPTESTVSQAITLEASVASNANLIYGAKTVLIQQGKIVLLFGSSRQEYHSGDTTINRIYAQDLSGKPVANQKISYQIYQTIYDSSSSEYNETTLNSGAVTTDANGFALIQQSVTTSAQSITLRATTKDAVGNTVQAERSMDILMNAADASDIYYHNLTLANLDVATDKLQYTVGDTANLTINSPFDQNVLVDYESGRIYHAEWLHLNKGDNAYKISITPQLSPSFNLVFSYFNNEILYVEGMQMAVTDPAQNLVITTATDKTTYAKNDQAQLTITTKDSNGSPVSAHVAIDVVDESIFNLRNNLPSGSIYWNFYSPRMDTTNFSASTLGIGTGGGCGGGSGTDILYVPNLTGNNYYWNPNAITDQNGILQVTVPLPNASGDFRVLITGSTDATAVGQSQSILSVQ